MPRTRHPSDADFPHGTQRGYNLGCRPKLYTCPASPSCSQEKAAAQRRLRAIRGSRPPEHPDWPKTSHVQRRLRATVKKVGVEAVAERSGLPVAVVRRALRQQHGNMDPQIAEPLDHAWTYYVWGVDSLAPGFPHGVVTSYNTGGCRCGKCRVAQARMQARSRAGITTGHTIMHVPELAEHTQRLLAVAGPTPVARAAGVAVSAIQGARNGDRVRANVARKIMATTEADVARAARIGPAARAHQQLRSMWALGYPLRWIAGQDDRLTYRRLDYLRPDGYVLAPVAEAIAAVALKVGDTPAGPDQGVSHKSAAQARSNARKAGYYPPMFYDQNGNLDPRAIPGHPWSHTDDLCARSLRLAKACAEGTRSHAQIAADLHHSQTQVERMLARLGLRSVGKGRHGVHPDCQGRADRILSLIASYEACERGPVEVALEIGARPTHGLAKDHPEVVAWVGRWEQQETAA